MRLMLLRLLYLVLMGSPNLAKFVGNVKDGEDDGTITILDIQDDNKTQYLNQNFEQGNYNYGYDIKPSGPVGQFHHENKAPDNVVYGCYGYEGPDSKNHMVFYISDSWGYRPVRQEEDTEIFFPADNPGGGHQKGTMVKWADLIFPDMCAHFAERIASSTNVVTKAPIQVASPPSSFTPTKVEETEQSNTAQTAIPSSPVSPGFGNKNTAVPSGAFDVVHLNKPSTTGPASSSPFSRLTTGSRQPTGAASSNNPTSETQSNVNNVIPSRPVPTNVGSTRPSGITGSSNVGLRTTPSPNLSESEGSNDGGLNPTGNNRTPQGNSRPSSFPRTPSTQGPATNPFTGQQNSFRPTPSSSRLGNPTGQSSNDPNPVDTEPTNEDLIPGDLTSNTFPNGPTGGSQTTTTQPALETESTPSIGQNFGDRHTTGPSGNSGRPTGNNRFNTGPNPTTSSGFRGTPTGSGPSSRNSETPNAFDREGSNSGLITPAPQLTGSSNFGRLTGPNNFSVPQTNQPSRSAPGTSGARTPINRGNTYSSSGDEDNTVNPTGKLSFPTGPGSRVPSSGTSGRSPGNTGSDRTSQNRLTTPNPGQFNRGTSFSPLLETGTTLPNESSNIGQNRPSPLPLDPDSNQQITLRKPTGVPSSSRFPSGGFSGFNNPSNLQPSSTNQQRPNLSSPSAFNTPENEQGTGGRNPVETRPAGTTGGQRQSFRTTPPPHFSQTTFIPQEPEIDNGIPQTHPSFGNGIVNNNQGNFPTDTSGQGSHDPFTGRPTNPTFGTRNNFIPTRSPTAAPRAPAPQNNFSRFPQGRNETAEKENELYCSSQCTSCMKNDASPPPPVPREEDYLNIPGAMLAQVPVIFVPDCTGNIAVRPAIIPFCPSTQSQCNNQPLSMRFPDSSNFLVGQDGPVARNAFASARKEGGPRLTRKVRRGHSNPRRVVK